MVAIAATEPRSSQSDSSPTASELSIAAINGPASLVVSGEPEALDELLEPAARQRACKTKRLAVAHASHSAQIEPMLRGAARGARADLASSEPQIPFVLQPHRRAARHRAGHRPRLLVSPTCASRCASPTRSRALLEQGATRLPRARPRPGARRIGLQESARGRGRGRGAAILGTLRREDGGPEALRRSPSPRPTPTAPRSTGRPSSRAPAPSAVALPTYPFQRKRYWLEPPTRRRRRRRVGQATAEHPLLGAAIEDPDGEGLTLTGRLSLATHPWLADHAVAGTVLLPGTAFVELALRAGERGRAPRRSRS